MSVVRVQICFAYLTFILFSCHLSVYIYLLHIVSICLLFVLCAALSCLLFLIPDLMAVYVHPVDFLITYVSVITSGTNLVRMYHCLNCGSEVQGLFVSL